MDWLPIYKNPKPDSGTTVVGYECSDCGFVTNKKYVHCPWCNEEWVSTWTAIGRSSKLSGCDKDTVKKYSKLCYEAIGLLKKSREELDDTAFGAYIMFVQQLFDIKDEESNGQCCGNCINSWYEELDELYCCLNGFQGRKLVGRNETCCHWQGVGD